jgi:tetratricopeptide (TPR) repeat protein
LGDNPCWAHQALQFSRQFGEGLLAHAMHDEARARRAFTAARLEQEQLLHKQKDYGPALCILGLIDAGLGNKEAALQEGRRAVELLPREKDAINSEALIDYFAVIAAWTGEKDLAIEQLRAALPLYGASAITSFIAGAIAPFGVAVDGSHVYWANFGAGTIGRADLDGQNANQSFITGANSPAGVAVDPQ